MRFHQFLIFLLLCSLFQPVLSQTPKIDSLRNEIKLNNLPNNEVTLHHNIYQEFYSSGVYYDSAFYYAKKAYNITKKNNLKKKEVNALFDLAAVYNAVEKRDSALKYYKKSIRLSKKLNYTDRVLSITNNIGDIYMEKKMYSKAMTYFKEVLKIAKSENNKQIEAIEYLNIGEVYYYTGKLEESKLYLQKSEKLYETLPSKPISTNYIIARTQNALNEGDLAEKKALEGYNAIKDEKEFQTQYKYALLLSEIYTRKEDFKNATKFNQLALSYNDAIHDNKSVSEIEGLFIKMELQEQNNKLRILEQKNKYRTIIYCIGGFLIILLVILIFRQLKIVKMTKNIHDIQTSLVEYELELKKNKNKSAFEATVSEDQRFKL